MAAEEAAAAAEEKPSELEKPSAPVDDMGLPEGFEMPDLSDLDAMMKEAGFGAIRIPVTWYNHMDKDGNVNAEWMARVKQVVDYALAEGLYCIINVHHDTGADEAGKHVSWIKAEGANYEKNKSKFEKLWLQIATEFKDYDQKLLFESYNEMLDKYSSWNYATSNKSGGYNETEAMDAYKAINDYAQSFVNVVRGTEGNNGVRNLVVNTYGACCGGKWGSNELPMGPIREMKLPDDVTSNHLLPRTETKQPGCHQDPGDHHDERPEDYSCSQGCSRHRRRMGNTE